ncbi:PAS domain-containing protein [Streptomyces olivoreticuli]
MSSRPSRGAARLAAILDALPDALLLVNCNGTVVNANHIALETFEVPGTGLVGRGLLSLLPDFDSRRIPGSMRLPDSDDGRTKPTRMIARRTDGSQFPVEVTSANLEDGRTPYADHSSYTGDELLMLVVRDLTGTLDTEAELARQQRQTEMILRAAAEGVVGVDTAGKVVLVNPSAAQILGYRASDLGGQELHPLIHHSRGDGTPFPYEESPIADTLRSGRKHRVRGQVLWAKDGRAVPVDLTTAPVRDGDQLVGAVMTFTDRRAHDALAARHAQLLAVLETSLRGPLEQLRGELGTLADDPAGQLWPEANQILHHLSAGYARMSTLVDNVLAYQRLDAGETRLTKEAVPLDEVVAAGVEGAIELIGPGRAQFAVHAPAIEAEVDAERFAQALAHLIADVAGVDATGNTSAPAASGSGDSTIVVAAAQRGEVVRIEVRGPYAGGDPVHGPIVRGIVRGHGGVLQTHDMPGAGGSAYVLEVPVSAEAGPVTASPERWAAMDTMNATTVMPVPAQRARGTAASEPPSGANAKGEGAEQRPEPQPTGRRRARPRADEEQAATVDGRHGQGTEGAGLVPPQGTPAPTGRRARREQRPPEAEAPRTAFALPPAEADRTPDPTAPAPTGRRARRGVAEAPERPIPGQANAEPDLPRTAFALPPAPATPPAEEKGSSAGTDDMRQAVAVPPAPEPGRTAAFVTGTGDAPVRPDTYPAQGGTAPAGVPQQGATTAPATPGQPGGYPGGAPTAPHQGRPEHLSAPRGAATTGAPHQGGTTAFLAAGGDAAPGTTAAAGVPQQARHEHPSAPGGIATPAAPGQPGGGAPSGPAPYAPEGGPGAGTAAFLTDPDQGPATGGAAAPAAVGRSGPAPYAVEGGPHQARPEGRPAPGATTAPATPGQPGGYPGGAPTAPHQGRPEHLSAPRGAATTAAPHQGGTAAFLAGDRDAAPGGTATAGTPRQARPEHPSAPYTAAGDPDQGPATGGAAAPFAAAGSPNAARPEHPSAPDGIAVPAAPGQPGGGVPSGPGAGTAAFLADPGQGPAPFAVAGGSNTTDAPHPVQPEAGSAHQGRPGGHPAPGAAGTPVDGVPGGAAPVPGGPSAWPAPGGTATAGTLRQDQPRTGPATGDAATPAVPGGPGAHPAPDNASAPVEGAPGRTGAHPTAPHQDRPAPGGTAQTGAPAQAASAPVDPAAAAVSRVQQQARPVAASEPDGAATAMDDTPHQGLPKVPGGAPYGSAHPQDADAPGGEVRPGGAAHPDPHADAAAPTGRRRARRALAEEPGAAAPQGEAARPISVRTLGQGPGGGETPPGGTPVGSGRRRKLGNPSEEERQTHTPSAATARPQAPGAPQGRAFAIGAPDEGTEGPEPLDGPNGAVEVVGAPRPPMDDELPPEPLDNPRRLLVWPAPDASTQTALTERGYRPVIVHSREEVDAQIAAYPAALFVDPLTGPITRTALQSLREAAGAAEVPVLVTAGLGQATKEAAYGADPAVLLKALAPRDSEMHPSRVLLIEEQEPIADALAATLERRGMQVARAATDADAVTLAAELRPNLVVMDLMQVRRRRAGIVDWLRANGLLSRTPLVVYTSAGMDPTQLAMLAAGETVLFLAERSTSAEVQGRIVDLLSKLG